MERLIIVIALLFSRVANGFLQQSIWTHPRQLSISPVVVSQTRDSSIEDLDETRRQLEHLMGPSVFLSQHPANSTPPPALTVAHRRRLELEIELLEALVSSDDPIDLLMNLWIHECPSAASSIAMLHQLEKECPHPTTAERALRTMVQDYPTWPEPAARLALLLGLQQDRGGEAQHYVDRVLSHKPWHFEAQHMQVLLCLQQHHRSQAIRCARERLPPLTSPQRRAAWVERSVALARGQLERLEEQQQAMREKGDQQRQQQQQRDCPPSVWE